MELETAPLVSVLLPAYNAASTLGVCLRSIERQTLGGWECIVVDDGSTDRTAEHALGFARRDVRFRLLRLPHGGLVAALNAGLGHCRGTFVARMDADDLMHRRRLAEQAALLEADPDLAGAGCHVRIFPRRGLGRGYREYEAWLNGISGPEAVRREAFVECPLAHPTLMLRRPRLAQLGYRDCGWPEDYDLILRLLAAGNRLGVLRRRRLAWCHRPHRLSRNGAAYRADRFTACKASFLADSFLAGTEHYILWGYGATGRTLCQALAARGKLPSHIIELHPGRLGNRIHGAPVVPPSELVRLPRRPLLVSVARAAPRERIRVALAGLGFEELRDFVCVA